MAEETFFRVTFARPDGWEYATTGRASSEKDAVRLAHDFLEHVERVGIADYLRADGLTVEPPARLTVERVPSNESGAGFGLVITDPDGNVIQR